MVNKIISYNVNGLRAAVNKGLLNWVNGESPDILCLQETKLQEGQIDIKLFEQLGYHHYWHYAKKKGYSGVAIFSKQKPDEILYGIGNPKFDDEGRTVIARYKDTFVASVYFPSGTMGDERQSFKMEWLSDFHKFISEFKKENKKIIISGDYNICHKPIDINFPKKHETYSGFLPEERAWMDEFTGNGFVDSFREFNKEPNQYSWWTYRAGAREKNLGWRIDYHMVTEALKEQLKGAAIYQHIYHSDHCPVVVHVDI